MTRVVFFGTPDEAVPALEALHQQFEVSLVVTQPDRPRGRSKTPVPPPVKVFAQTAGIPVVQPESAAEIAAAIAGRGDLGVVVAYGRILRSEVLESFEHGILNIHFSLLPRWRGAAPVARALMAGDTTSGITVIRIDSGLDTGPMLAVEEVNIATEENAGQLTDRLATLGARVLVETIPGYLDGDITPVDQPGDGATYADKLTPADRLLDLDDDPAVFLGRVRGLAPNPGATLTIDGEATKILSARAEGTPPLTGTWESQDGWPVVNVGGTAVTMTQLQPPGKKAMSGDDWIRGRHRSSGRVG